MNENDMLENLKNEKDNIKRAEMCVDIARMYFNIEKVNLASEYYDSALYNYEYAPGKHDFNKLCETHMEITENYVRLGQLGRAVDYMVCWIQDADKHSVREFRKYEKYLQKLIKRNNGINDNDWG